MTHTHYGFNLRSNRWQMFTPRKALKEGLWLGADRQRYQDAVAAEGCTEDEADELACIAMVARSVPEDCDRAAAIDALAILGSVDGGIKRRLWEQLSEAEKQRLSDLRALAAESHTG